VAAGTLASRVTGFARLFALAYVLGTARLADAFNLANNTPNMIYDLVLGGILGGTLVPVFVERLSSRREDEAWEAISAIVSVAVVVLVVATIVFELAAAPIADLYLLADHAKVVSQERAVTIDLLRLLAPEVLFYGLSGLATAVLNARRRFGAPAFAPVLNNLVAIAILFALRDELAHPTLGALEHSRPELLLLGLGTMAGVGLQAFALLPSLLSKDMGLGWFPSPRHEAVRQVLQLSGWVFGFVAANQVTLFVVLTLAAHFSGGVASYNYAYTFFQLPYGVVAASVITALQPEMARHFALGDLSALSADLTKGLKAVGSIVAAAAVGYLILGGPVLDLVLLHGAARVTGIADIRSALELFALGLPGFSVFLVCIRTFQSMQDTKTPFWIYLVENGVNVVAAFALVGPLGVGGLALSLSLAYTVGAVVALAALARRGVRPVGLRWAWVGRVALVLGVMAAAVEVVDHVIVGHGEAIEAVRVVLAALIGVSVFFLMAVRMGRSSILSADQPGIRRLRGRSAGRPSPSAEPGWRHRSRGAGPRRP